MDSMSGMGGPRMGGIPGMAGMTQLANDPIIVHLRDYAWVYVAAFVASQFGAAAYLLYLFFEQYRTTQILKRGEPAVSAACALAQQCH